MEPTPTPAIDRDAHEARLRRAQDVLARAGTVAADGDPRPDDDVGASWWTPEERAAARAVSETRNREIDRKQHEAPDAITDDDLRYLERTGQARQRWAAVDARTAAGRPTARPEPNAGAPRRLTTLDYEAVDAWVTDSILGRDTDDQFRRTGFCAREFWIVAPLLRWLREINQKNHQRNERIAALEQRVRELEARPTHKYRGVFTEGAWYDPLNSVTRDGSLWMCLARTNATPGGGDPAWQLCVKRGADGKPGRDAR